MANSSNANSQGKHSAKELGQLIRACQLGDAACVRQMLQRGISPNHLVSQFGTRPLTAAVRARQTNVVRVLLDAGADPNLQDTWEGTPPNCTPLEVASAQGDVSVAKLLIRAGADIDMPGYWAPLKTAASYGQAPMVSMLLKCKAKLDPADLSLAARSGSAKSVALLIKAGADVNYVNKNGETPLHFAAVLETDDVAKVLVNSGAKLDAENRHKETALHRAAAKGHTSVIRFLLKSGADSKRKNFKGKTPEQWARAFGKNKNADLIKQLAT